MLFPQTKVTKQVRTATAASRSELENKVIVVAFRLRKYEILFCSSCLRKATCPGRRAPKAANQAAIAAGKPNTVDHVTDSEAVGLASQPKRPYRWNSAFRYCTVVRAWKSRITWKILEIRTASSSASELPAWLYCNLPATHTPHSSSRRGDRTVLAH